MVTRQPGKWMAKGWGFSCEITWPFWPFSLAAIPNSQETPAYNSVKASKGDGERKSGKEASRWCLFPRSPSVCSLGQRWLEGATAASSSKACSLTGFTLPTVKRFSPTSGIGKPAVNRRKPLETARNDNSNSKTGNRCLPTGNRCLPTGNRRF